jgi:hypothetical protein
MTLTNFPGGLSSFGVPVLPGLPALFSRNSRVFFVDPVNGADGNPGTELERPLATLYKAHALCVSGQNDTVCLIGNGQAAGSARLSLALAVGVDAAATTGVLTWSKSATHLIGITAPTGVAQRARIAPPSGTYTQATFNSGNFVVVTGDGCMFSNIHLFHGFSTGGTNQICWTDNGERNFYYNMHFGGMGDATSAQNAGSRSLKVGSGGNGEHTFVNCTIGLDTVTRTVANASLELAGATPRNTFTNCIFPMITSSATSLFGLGTGAGCVDRWNLFRDCSFINNMDSGSTALTGAFTLPASAGGLLMMQRCSLVGDGSANWGTDATTLNQMYVDGAAPTAGTSGLAVNPT